MALAASIFLVIFMLSSTTAFAAPLSTLVSAPYTGHVHLTNLLSASGCGTRVSEPELWDFHVGTGKGGGVTDGSAGSCGKVGLAPFGNYSESNAAGGFDALIRLPTVPIGATSIAANLSGGYTISMLVRDGGLAANCPTSPYLVNYTSWGWNYGGLGAYNSSVYFNGSWSNVSYGVGSVPSPFKLNASTSYYHYTFNGTYGSCEAATVVNSGVEGELHFGRASRFNTTTFGAWEVSDFAIAIVNRTFHGYYLSYAWNTGSSYETNSSGYLNEDIPTSFEFYSYSSGAGSYSTTSPLGASTSTGFSNLTNLSRSSISFHAPFTSLTKLTLAVTFYFAAVAWVTGWAHGFAKFQVNAGTKGDKIGISSIGIW